MPEQPPIRYDAIIYLCAEPVSGIGPTRCEQARARQWEDEHWVIRKPGDPPLIMRGIGDESFGRALIRLLAAVVPSSTESDRSEVIPPAHQTPTRCHRH